MVTEERSQKNKMAALLLSVARGHIQVQDSPLHPNSPPHASNHSDPILSTIDPFTVQVAFV